MGSKRVEDAVGDGPLQAPKRLLRGLALAFLLQVVSASLWMSRDLGERNEVDDAVQLPVASPVQTVPLGPSGARSKGRRPVGHGELGLRPEPGDVPDLGEELGRRELGNPRDRGEPCVERGRELSDLLGEVTQLLGELWQPCHPLTGNPSTNPIVAGK